MPQYFDPFFPSFPAVVDRSSSVNHRPDHTVPWDTIGGFDPAHALTSAIDPSTGLQGVFAGQDAVLTVAEQGSTITSRIAPRSVPPREIYAPGPFLVSNHYADVAANGARMDALDAHHVEAIGSPGYPNPHNNLGIRPVPTHSSWNTWMTRASHPLQQPQNSWGQHSHEQDTACTNQAHQRYLVAAEKCHVDTPTQTMTFTDSATAQGSMPVNGTGFQYYEWTSEAHSHLPLSQDSVQLRYTELAAINWASLSSYGNEATAHSRNQTGSKHPQVVVGVQNQSIPNYRPNKCSHDDGHACDTTFVPPTMTARLEQLEGSSRPVNDPALRNSVPKTPTPTTPSPTRTRRRRRRRRTPPTAPITDIMLTEERICKYVSRKGKPCGLNMASIAGWKVARHWYSCHAMKEWKQIQKKMVMAEATIMNTPARLQVGNSYAARCPFTFCRHPNNPNKRYMRPDSLNRHMRACAKDYNANTSTRVEEKVSASALQSASRCAQSNMRLGQYDQEEFGDEYQAAVWTIHHA